MKLAFKNWLKVLRKKVSTLRWMIKSYHRKVQIYKQGVVHATFDPKGPGVVRLHLVPPKPSFRHDPDSLLVIQGYFLINVGHAFAAILRTFIQELVKRCPTNREISMEEVEAIETETIRRVKKDYPKANNEKILSDLRELVTLAIDIAKGNDLPKELKDGMDLSSYFRYAPGPQRMDLVISPMKLKGRKHCPLNCKVCYAKNQKMMDLDDVLTTHQWKKIIDKCRQAGIPMITFTGGEPLMREDIVELVEHAQWFITRINTNGWLLTPDLAKRLYEASLDGIQFTLYSDDPAIHDEMVDTIGAWAHTMAAIKSALEAGLMVSVNTPLLVKNRDYTKTIRFFGENGVRCVTCSGLIPTGGAEEEMAIGHALTQMEMKQVLAEAVATCNELAMDISFTSPGWLSEAEADEIGLPSTPVCGACSSNMAVAPNGEVVPCQSWLGGESLGNILKTPWNRIWKSKRCQEIRTRFANKGTCALKKEG